MKRLPWKRENHYQERIHRIKNTMSHIDNSSKIYYDLRYYAPNNRDSKIYDVNTDRAERKNRHIYN